jgi:dolichol kinase
MAHDTCQRWSPLGLEQAVVLLSVGAVALALLARVPGHSTDAAALLALGLAVARIDSGAPIRNPRFSLRRAARGGLSLGLTTVPCTLVAVLLSTAHSRPPGREPSPSLIRFQLHAALASSGSLLLGIALGLLDRPARAPRAAAVALLPALCTALVFRETPVLLLLGACALVEPVLRLLLGQLPYCFSVGEGAVLCQAASLLAVDAAVLVGCGGWRPAIPARHPSLCVPRDLVLSVVEVGLLGALLLGAWLALTLRLSEACVRIGQACERAMGGACERARGGALCSSNTTRAIDAVASPSSCASPPSLAHPSSDEGRPAPRAPLVFASVAVFVALVLYPLLWAGLSGRSPVEWIVDFLTERPIRLGLLAYWAALTACSTGVIGAVRTRMPLILVRKLYHALAVLLFLPGILIERELMRLAFAVALALFLALEYIRMAGAQPLQRWLTSFLERYTDARDAGPLITTHIYLLLGCALPVLATPVETMLPLGAASSVLPPMAGVLALGVGDSVASYVGTRFGRTRWAGTLKTVEGTVAAVSAIMVGAGALCVGSAALGTHAAADGGARGQVCV